MLKAQLRLEKGIACHLRDEIDSIKMRVTHDGRGQQGGSHIRYLLIWALLLG